MSERWAPVPFSEWAEIYEVSNIGRFRNSKTGRVNRGRLLIGGYPYVQMKRPGRREWKCLHRMVAVAFVPNPRALDEVNHKDFDRENCTAENLEWVTHSENMKHQVATNRARGTYRNAQQKLKDSDIPRIRQMRKDGKKLKAIGEVFGVSDNIVSQICNRKRWVHVP